jgi:hypothetical protein
MLDRHPIVGSLTFAVPFRLPLLLLVLVLFVTTLAVWNSKFRAA